MRVDDPGVRLTARRCRSLTGFCCMLLACVLRLTLLLCLAVLDRSLRSVAMVFAVFAAGGLRGSAKVQAGQVYFGEATDGQGAWLDIASTVAASEHAFGPPRWRRKEVVGWLWRMCWPARLPVVAALRQLRSPCIAWHVSSSLFLLWATASLDLLNPCGTPHASDVLQCNVVVTPWLWCLAEASCCPWPAALRWPSATDLGHRAGTCGWAR